MNVHKILIILATLVVLLITSRSYQNQALSFHFVDEEDNLVLGKYLLQGEKLYEDLFSHHQPLSYVFSAGVQKLTSPNSIFLLIKRHREAVIFWAAAWSIFLVARFGLPMLLTVIIFEPLKIFLLGNLFLSESLVVYPLVYLLSWAFLSHHPPTKYESVFLGFCFILTWLLLAPLWPATIFLFGMLLWQKKLLISDLLPFFLGSLPLLAVSLLFMTPAAYFNDVFYINFKYYIPLSGQPPLTQTALAAFFTPFLSLLSWEGRSATLQVTQFLSGLLILNWGLMLTKKQWKLVILMFLALGLINIRYVMPGQQTYSGFHLLPWFASLILMAAITTFIVWKSYQVRRWQLSGTILLIGALSVTVKEAQGSLFATYDINKDFYINYSRQTDFGQAVKIMKTPGEKLMVVPDEWLIYWQADIDHASVMVNYYAWMSKVPQIRDPLYQIFAQTPPTYLYCDCKWGYFGLEEYFLRYVKLTRDGQETKLMVLKEKVPTLTKDQKDQLDFYNFKF